MVNLQKSDNSAVKFVFTDSDHYLYGNGEIEVPVNSLLLVIDDSEMVTFKKLSGDPFLSFRADNSNLGTKAAIEQFYKENMVGSTGGGGDVTIDPTLDSGSTNPVANSAITTALDAKADTAVVNQAISEATQAILSVSGDVQTKVATSDFNAYSAATATALNGKVDSSALNDYYTKTEVYNKQEVDAAYGTAYQALTAHTADTSIHVTSAEKTTWNNKSDFSGDYNDLTNKPTIPTVPTNISDFTNDAGYITNADITGKADTSAVTQVNDALTAHTANTSVHVTQVEKDAWNAKVDTSAITTAITSGSTDDEIPTAKAVYDATQSGGGGMDDDTQQLISTALNDLNDRKADLTELSKYQKKGDYVKTSTFTETLADYMTNDAFDEYATAKERIISGALNDLDNRMTAVESGGSVTVDTTLDSGSTNPVANSAITTAIDAKQDVLSAGTGIEISGNVISATGGGGATYSAGTNISIDTANTINCTLPITITNSDDNSKQSIAIGDGSSAHISNFFDSITIGKNSKGYFGSVVIGSNPTAYTTGNGNNVAIGNKTKFYDNSVIIGSYAQGYNDFNANNVAIGVSARANNIKGAVAIGYDVATFDTTKTNINNQLKIDTNNQVYIKDKTNTTEVCIQDAIAALGGLKLVKLTQAEYDALATKDSSTLYIISD